MNTSGVRFTWTLMRYASDILRKDRKLIVFPILSSILCLALFAAMFYGDVFAGSRFSEEPDPESWSLQGKVFLFLFWSYFLITFFNSAIIGAAILRLRGSNPTLGDGFRIAFSRLPWIAGWALVSATLVVALRLVEEKLKGGRWLRMGLEVSWALASFLVVPIIVVERQEPFRALRTSASLIRKTWGEQIVANFSFRIVQMIFIIPAVVLAFMVSSMDIGSSGHLFYYAILACYAAMIFLVITTLEVIFKAALYCHIRDIETPGEVLPSIAAAAIIPDVT